MHRIGTRPSTRLVPRSLRVRRSGGGLGNGGDALANVVEDADVGVIEGGDGARLLFERLAAIRVGGGLARQDLQGHGAPQAGVAGAVHLAHASDAQQRGNLVRPEPRSRGKSHRHRLPRAAPLPPISAPQARVSMSLDARNGDTFRFHASEPPLSISARRTQNTAIYRSPAATKNERTGASHGDYDAADTIERNSRSLRRSPWRRSAPRSPRSPPRNRSSATIASPRSGTTRIVFVAEGDLWRVGVAGRRRAAAHHAPGGGEPAGHLARRQNGGLRRQLRRARRGLHAAARGRRARAPHLGRDPPGMALVDAEGRGALRHPPALDAAEHATCAPRPGHRHADHRAARPGLGRLVRRGGRHAVLHAPGVPGQPHPALQGRHGPEPVAVRRRRHGGRRPHRRLPGHEQDADARGKAESTSRRTATA